LILKNIEIPLHDRVKGYSILTLRRVGS